jgi:uncharacterized protein (UPF0332 family)
VTPETQEHLDKAREYLVKARGLLDVMRYNDEAGRAAYLAGFHAAQAVISERTGQIAKTHEGVNSQFNLLTRDNLKAVADYETGPGSVVPPERVEAALSAAARFVDVIAGASCVAGGSRPGLQGRRKCRAPGICETHRIADAAM